MTKRAVLTLTFLLILIVYNSPGVCGQANGAKQPKKASAPFSLFISGPASAPAGSPVKVTVRLTNTSNHQINGSIEYDVSGVDYGYLYEVRDGKGDLIEQKKHDWSRSGQNSVEVIMLKPGESRDNVTLVSAAYDLSKPGKYTIQISMPVSNDPGAALVKSNAITVTVEP
jgi:hypothetical protein